jgi:hypothetical protein
MEAVEDIDGTAEVERARQQVPAPVGDTAVIPSYLPFPAVEPREGSVTSGSRDRGSARQTVDSIELG